MNLDPDLTPLNLSAVNQLDGRSGPATATFSGAFATGAILQGDRLLLAQGNSANGIASTSTQLSNTAQQLVIDLAATQTVDNDELTGVVGSSLNTTYTANEVQARTNLSMVVMAAYGGLVGQPGDTARWAGGILGQGSTAAELVDAVLADPGWQARSTAHFGGSLSSLSVDTITGITAQTLFARSASSAELAYWNQQVAAGLNRTLVPLAMAQQTARPDRYRLAYLSTSGQWLAGQAGSQAMVNGSFSQGFQNDLARFTPIHSLPFTAGALGSWAEANAALDGLKANALRDLLGTPVSKSGFF